MTAVYAHRGCTEGFVENTLEAFAEARRLGADGVELDVRLTADGALAVHHDAEIPGIGVIGRLAVADLPVHVPLLGDVLGACEGLEVNIEIKNAPGDPACDPTEAVAALIASCRGGGRLDRAGARVVLPARKSAGRAGGRSPHRPRCAVGAGRAAGDRPGRGGRGRGSAPCTPSWAWWIASSSTGRTLGHGNQRVDRQCPQDLQAMVDCGGRRRDHRPDHRGARRRPGRAARQSLNLGAAGTRKRLSPGRMAGNGAGPQRWSAMNVVVCVKQIPDPAVPGSLEPDTNTLDRSGKLIMDDSDNYGVEMALQLAAGDGDEVTLVSMAPGGETSGLRTGLAMGAAKAILVSDEALAGSDALGTAKVLAAAIGRANPDLVVVATESTDGYTGTLPVQVAELLGLPSVTFAKAITVDGCVGQGRAPDRGRLRRGRLPPARRGDRDRRRGRAALPVVQGDHGGQVQAGREPDRGRSGRRRLPGRRCRAPARRSPTSPRPRPAPPARSWSTRVTARSVSWPSSSS